MKLNNNYLLIDSVNKSHQPVIISGQNNNAVLLSEMDWKSMQETVYLLVSLFIRAGRKGYEKV